ncbi:MAG TPA: tetratricopeptide repeat protein [Flavobacteriales bacterium]|nr:tetratricopeptide repeat protein [Flavobacteriales bacterium]
MKKIKCCVLTGFSLLCCVLVNSYNIRAQHLDSLARAVNTAKHAESRMVALENLAFEYMFSNPDTALIINEKALALAKKLRSVKHIAQYNYERAIFYQVKTNLEKAMTHYETAIDYYTEMTRSANRRQAFKGHKGISKANNNLGNIQFELGNYAEALRYYFFALNKSEIIKEPRGEADCLKGIGTAYLAQGDAKKGIGYLQRSLVKAQRIRYTELESSLWTTLGTAYNLKGDFDSGIVYLNRGLALADSLGHLYNKAICFGNLAVSYNGKKQFEKSEMYYNKALDLYRLMGQRTNVAITYLNLGHNENQKGNVTRSEAYYKRSMEICDSVGSMNIKLKAMGYLYKLYDSIQRPAQALDYFKQYMALRKTIHSNENTRRQTEIELKYTYSRKKATDSIQLAEKKRVLDAGHRQALRSRNIYLYAGLGGFLVMIVVSIISFSAFRHKKKANQTIAAQKLMVEHKQKEILDSIRYAKRIQTALLPSESKVNRTIQQMRNNK